MVDGVLEGLLRETIETRPVGECLALKDELRGSFPPWRYVLKAVDGSENLSASESSSLLRREVRASDYVRGSTVQKPFAPAGMPVKRRILNQALARQRRDALERGDYHRGLPDGIQNAVGVSLYSFSLQDPAMMDGLERSAEQMQASEVRRARNAAEHGEMYTLNDDRSGSNVPKSLTQEGFRIDSVFHRGEDEQLFGMATASGEETDEEEGKGDDKEEYDEDEEEEEEEEEVAKDQAEKDTEDGVDALLDRTIEDLDRLLQNENRVGTYRNRKHRRKREGKSGGDLDDEDERWATEDTSDISNFHKLVPNPVKTYPFDLDPFQKRAILHLERSENVFVAAHTSAGKTVVAEYAIALAEEHQTKVIYTSPIKTLSNQKFRDFSDTFREVGIVTGDVSFQQDAACLVMTTEVLRSMLYKGAGLIRDVEWVIFDEVHYVNDPERGVVWEEVIIMLPEHIHIVMLSATVPNALDFARWVGRSRRSKVFVISTLKRPVPLEHSLFVKKSTFLIMDGAKKFISKNFNQALAHDSEGKETVKGRPRHAWGALVQHLRKHDLMPTVVFCFSKRKCEDAAEMLRQADLSNGTSDKAQVHSVFELAYARLSPADRQLPQILRMLDILKRGIGVHHAGLLPIVKEVTEILFQRGIVRILFATETFAMGVNMPARTVVFSSLQKHDGQQFRYLQPGEYTQMAGRAGRRGLDKTGNVLLYFRRGEIPSELEVSNVLTGRPLELVSQFRLTYNMILNLLRIEELRVEDMIRRSFAEAPAGRDTRRMKQMIEKGTKTLMDLHSQHDFLRRFEEYHNLWEEMMSLSAVLSAEIFTLSRGIAAGQVVLLRRGKASFGIGVALRPPKRESSSVFASRSPPTMLTLILYGGPSAGQSRYYSSDAELAEIGASPDPNARGRSKGDGPASPQDLGGLLYEIRTVDATRVLSVTRTKLKVDAARLAPPRGKPDPAAVAYALEELRRVAEAAGELGSIDPRRDFGITELGFADAWSRREALLAELAASPEASSTRLEEALDALSRMYKLEVRIQRLQWAASDESLQLHPDYVRRLEVLRRLNYVSDDNTVQLKGRTACEVSTCDSLVLTELVMENVFKDLGPAESAAVMAALVCQEKSDEEHMPDELVEAKKQVDRIIFALGTVQDECGLPVSPLEFSRQTARWAMTELVLHWSRGEKFSAVLEFAPDVPEGSVVRCVVRLSELLREARNVARVIGDVELHAKMEEAMDLVKRDIIFAASLYLS